MAHGSQRSALLLRPCLLCQVRGPAACDCPDTGGRTPFLLLVVLKAGRYSQQLRFLVSVSGQWEGCCCRCHLLV